MKHYRRLIKFSMLLFIMTFVLCINASAEYEIPQKEEGKYVYDVEGTIRSKALEKIESWCKELDEKADVQIFVITFKDIKGNTVAPYIKADEVHKFMIDEEKETITIFASQRENKIVVKSTKGVDIKSVGYINIFYTDEENDFSNAITKVVEGFVKALKKQNNVQIEDETEEKPEVKEQLLRSAFMVFMTIIIIFAFGMAIIVTVREERERVNRRR